MLVILVCAASAIAATEGSLPGIPVTGACPEPLRPVDDAVLALIAEWDIPGAAVAIAKNGEIICSRGYGWSNVEANEPVQPDSRFRIGSVTKPITAVAVLKLVQQGKLSLDDKAFELLEDLKPFEGYTEDPRLGDITVEDLLRHAGGWDRNYHDDPLLRQSNLRAAKLAGQGPPAGAVEVIRYHMGRPLDLFPGTKYAYSNLGYLILGRIVEAASGMPYEDYVRKEILKPAGIDDMYIGKDATEARREMEVRYYDFPDAPLERPLSGGAERPAPEGFFSLTALDAAAGWVASAPDLVRFAVALEGEGAMDVLLPEEMREAMLARPKAPLWVGLDHWYGLGWRVRPVEGGLFFWHNGTLPGATALLARHPKGYTYAVLMNSRPSEWEEFNEELNAKMLDAIADLGAATVAE